MTNIKIRRSVGMAALAFALGAPTALAVTVGPIEVNRDGIYISGADTRPYVENDGVEGNCAWVQSGDVNATACAPDVGGTRVGEG